MAEEKNTHETADSVTIHVENNSLTVPAGISVAAAVTGCTQEEHSYTTRNAVTGEKRAPYCLMGVCFECMMEVDGVPNTQTCLTPVRDGMVVRRQENMQETYQGAAIL